MIGLGPVKGLLASLMIFQLVVSISPSSLFDFFIVSTLTVTSIAEDLANCNNNTSNLNDSLGEDIKEDQKIVQQMAAQNNVLEGVIIVLKQAKIPLMISTENLKEDIVDWEDMVKVKCLFRCNIKW